MRNAEATRERILQAALAEFSAHGIAGARVDRIARTAGCNKNLIYIYFEDKETLFKTVLCKHLTRVHEEQPFTPDDLPGYAAKVFDFAMANPDLLRLVAWSALEQPANGSAERVASLNAKLAALTEARKAGQVGTAFPPGLPPRRGHEPGHGLVGDEPFWAVAQSESRRASGRRAGEPHGSSPSARERG
ncbi:MAG TPA: TetR family transcriptional regulator [Pirellulales bacterium]|nr:TetR family transcriptional regulator [Pirellulales bacterium]